MLPFIYFQERLKLISILGAGLLVGVALAVIIPEGIQMLYSQQMQGMVVIFFTNSYK